MHILVILLYGLACILCGFMGRKTTLGFIGHFLLAIFITPVLSFGIQAVSRPAPHHKIQDQD
jgi:hypothetical protein